MQGEKTLVSKNEPLDTKLTSHGKTMLEEHDWLLFKNELPKKIF